MIGIIICNGSILDYEYYKEYFSNSELVICADGGAVHAKRFGIKPDILIGDFDSIPGEELTWFGKLGVEILTFPAEKDMTDTEIAINTAIERGCTSLIIIGGIGSRLDHSLANIFLLKNLLDKGIKVSIINESNEITLINDNISLKRRKAFKVSLIPFTERVTGVTTKGLYYELNDATIEIGSTWGVSNEFVSDVAEVIIKSGTMLVIQSKD